MFRTVWKFVKRVVSAFVILAMLLAVALVVNIWLGFDIIFN